VMLGVLGVAALGSGAAVLRAMVSALQAARPDGASASPLVLAAIAMAVATALTASDLPIVDTMVSVNVVYIASVGTSLFGLIRDKRGHGVDETWAIAAGFVGAVAVYVPAWLGRSIPNVELLALLVGLASAALVRVLLHRRQGGLGHRSVRWH
jgi:solute:Na+ symporter, SSS family